MSPPKLRAENTYVDLSAKRNSTKNSALAQARSTAMQRNGESRTVGKICAFEVLRRTYLRIEPTGGKMRRCA